MVEPQRTRRDTRTNLVFLVSSFPAFLASSLARFPQNGPSRGGATDITCDSHSSDAGLFGLPSNATGPGTLPRRTPGKQEDRKAGEVTTAALGKVTVAESPTPVLGRWRRHTVAARLVH